MKVGALHYVNQFPGRSGGDGKAGTGPKLTDGLAGHGLLIYTHVSDATFVNEIPKRLFMFAST